MTNKGSDPAKLTYTCLISFSVSQLIIDFSKGWLGIDPVS